MVSCLVALREFVLLILNNSVWQSNQLLCLAARRILKTSSREPSDSVVECLTPDREAADLSLIKGTALSP